jgi:beta-galactosidase/beta-glucuronidase
VKLVLSRTSQEIDAKAVLYGIRTVSLDLRNKKFTVMVNGHQIYCKGSNYVPPDMFHPRLTNPDYSPAYTYK